MPDTPQKGFRIGVLSDTHGLLRPRVLELLAGCDRLLHAGDVGSEQILERLRRIAPVEAVRGNVDTEPPLSALPEVLSGHLGARAGDGDASEDSLPFRMTHRREDVKRSWAKEARLVVFGHSHRPELEWKGRCLYLNPGACGRRRFHLPLTLAILHMREGRLVPELLAVE